MNGVEQNLISKYNLDIIYLDLNGLSSRLRFLGEDAKRKLGRKWTVFNEGEPMEARWYAGL